VESLAQAEQIVTFYTYRWLIERFHYTLKSGCKLEDGQLRTEDRLERLLAVYSGASLAPPVADLSGPPYPRRPLYHRLDYRPMAGPLAFRHRTARLPATPPLSSRLSAGLLNWAAS
jgi:hypothetical protein